VSLGGSGSDSTCGSNRDALHEDICRSVAKGVTDGGVRAGRAFLPHEQEGEHADDPDADEDGLDQARCT